MVYKTKVKVKVIYCLIKLAKLSLNSKYFPQSKVHDQIRSLVRLPKIEGRKKNPHFTKKMIYFPTDFVRLSYPSHQKLTMIC